MSMIGVMVVTSTTYFLRYQDRKVVEEVTSQIKNQIELARSHAKTSRLPPSQVQPLRFVKVLSSNGLFSIVSDRDITYNSINLAKPGVFIGNLTNGQLSFLAGEVKLVNLDGDPLSIGSTVALNIYLINDPTVSKLIVINSSGVIKQFSSSVMPTATPLPTTTQAPTETPMPTNIPTPMVTNTGFPTPTSGCPVLCGSGGEGYWCCSNGEECGLYYPNCEPIPGVTVLPTATPIGGSCFPNWYECYLDTDCCSGYCNHDNQVWECDNPP